MYQSPHSSSTTTASVLDALLDTAIRAEFSSPPGARAVPCDPQALTEAEHAKLEELSEANKGILAPLCEDYNFKVSLYIGSFFEK